MLDEFGLNFGAFDIIRDEDDTLYFIELNPNGQWYWIEILTKMAMVRATVELIEDLALQYQQDLSEQRLKKQNTYIPDFFKCCGYLK
ncbi:hypothetical protein NDI47_09430 [Microcoleus vaginatus GB1-A2]|uniref:hypothetical protein n=1 Tax=Microcoleus vaginatus TaxID=119532 RepID=UPI00168A073C|nr:hypothetical protein [Microcoleus sp. FACHB-61]